MKIAYLKGDTKIPSTAANTVHVMKMCAAFVSQGHDVKLYTAKAFNEKRPNINVHKYYGVDNSFDLIRTIKPSITGGYTLHKAVSRMKILLRNPDVIYARNISLLKEMLIFSKPVMLEVHDKPSNDKMFNSIKEIISSKNFIGLVAISQALKNEYLNLYPMLTEYKITVAHDCADIPKNKVKEVNRNIAVGYVGHLYKGRGFELINMLAKQFSNIAFYIVGGTKEDIEREKNSCDCSNIIFEGFVPNGELYKYYAKFIIVLAPYQKKVKVAGGIGDTSKFMSPLKIFEYMSYQKAIICSDLPVLREVMRNGDNCLLCDPDDADAWASALKRLVTNTLLREQLVENAYIDFLENYTWDMRAVKLTKVMEDWIEKHAKKN